MTETKYFTQFFGSYQLLSETPAEQWATEVFDAALDLGLITMYQIERIERLRYVEEIHFMMITEKIGPDGPTEEQAKALADEIVHDTDVVIKSASMNTVTVLPD